MRTLITIALLATLSSVSIAAFPQSTERPKPKGSEVVDTVTSPARVQSGQALPKDTIHVPEISVRKVGDDTIEEHRVKGKLYKQHVQPAVGPAYTLIDEKGDGRFTRTDGPELKFAVPMWVLVEWK
jgi:hypothetical protein